ncbi:MAG: hypothetical protein IT379_34200 [Deltaproteobacteria bacterium]|nr:hypothetical protein [Deltaproteobacteria bacterium]
MHPSTAKEVPPELLDAARESERRLLSPKSLDDHVAHAENANRIKEALRGRKITLKQGFTNLGLDYTLAQHAIWIAETLAKHAEAHPEIKSLGPSLVLVVREAERRMEREGREHGIRDVVAALVAGEPRAAVRERFLPPVKRPKPGRVLALLGAGRTEAARRAFEDLEPTARTGLRRLAHALVRLVDVRAESRSDAQLDVQRDRDAEVEDGSAATRSSIEMTNSHERDEEPRQPEAAHGPVVPASIGEAVLSVAAAE